MKTKILIILALCCSFLAAEAGTSYTIPLLQYEQIGYGSQRLSATSMGIVKQTQRTNFVAIYTYNDFKKQLSYNYPEYYHALDCLYDYQVGKRQYLGIFKSESPHPVTGGWQTFQAAFAYGSKIVNKSYFTFTLGGGLALGDFGFEYDDGKNWPLIPVPLIRMSYQRKFLNASFDFLTGPNLSMVFFPNNKLRLNTDFRFDQLRDGRDLIFETALNYRFFSEEDKMGDFAGVSAGVKSDNKTSYPEDDEELYEMQYYAVFAAIDITLLKLTGGYQFNGRELYEEEKFEEMEDGYFISLQIIYPFQ